MKRSADVGNDYFMLMAMIKLKLERQEKRERKIGKDVNKHKNKINKRKI